MLDTSPIAAGSSARQALHNTVDLAILADELGYHRYWVPEHHGMRGVAGTAPAVLVGRLADATSRIRVGAGGVLLPNHPPLVVAEQFGTLAALHPGRIDLGVGRALGGPARVADAFQRGDDFPAQLAELIGYFTNDDQPLVAVPAIGNPVQFWLLGSSASSARLAASLGLAYAFAHHLKPHNAAKATSAYREACAAPQLIVSVLAIVADTDEDAERLAEPVRSRLKGDRLLVVGSPETVRKQLDAVADDTGAQELMISTPVHDHAARLRSYELLGGGQ